jgi:hypothetical protein
MGRIARAHHPERGGCRFGGWQPETRRSADQLAATRSFFGMPKTPAVLRNTSALFARRFCAQPTSSISAT